ncbi:MAG TPA: DmsE family decaheme c-type cytochrome [Thermoanaerobaculia bacterium]|nr:DmsE family decaheme c-type cytochrome [Thermoanaerobaculia bacterium]
MKQRWISVAIFVFAPVALMGAARAPREVNWTALNPAFADAGFVKDPSVCLTCHEESITKYRHTTHARAFKASPRTPLEALDCEACHGPRSRHVENPGDELAFGRMTAEGRSAVCLQCHEAGNEQKHWLASAHRSNGVACTDCHLVMERRSNTALLGARDQASVCYACHADVRGQMQKISHHPVREGKMECTSCHNPHGSAGPAMMRRATITDTCYSCHADKRGPFLFEHPPARENCATCHDAHGSNNPTLLLARGSFLCTQCHAYGGHINVPRYNRTSTAYGSGCVNCHIAPHGSNHPSGAKLTR